MNTLWTIIIALIIVGGASAYFFHQNAGGPLGPQGTAQTSANEEALVRATVTGFGTKLQMVSLLAPSTDLKAAMQSNYAAYVAPEILSAWESNPSLAPGRTVSSPWPDHIDITDANVQSNGSYIVRGQVVEATSTGTADSIPVTIIVEKRGTAWMITHFNGYPTK